MKKTGIMLLILLITSGIMAYGQKMGIVGNKGVSESIVGERSEEKITLLEIEKIYEGNEELINLNSHFIGKKIIEVRLEGMEGKESNLSDFVGTPFILEFMASWCPECLETDGMIKEYRRGENAAEVISVGVSDTTADLKSFSENNLNSYFRAIDSEKTLDDYHLTSVPIFFFVDEFGLIQFIYQGESTLEEFKTYATRILGK